jgi:putative toxin-antitoxin system antitoxin component (TIGR02293 family)
MSKRNRAGDFHLVKQIFGTTDALRLHDAILGGRISSAALIRAMRVLYLDKKTLARILSVSDATMNRRLKAKARLRRQEAECLVRLARIADLAARVLGAVKARRWLSQPTAALGGDRPIDRLSTELSGREVERVLLDVGCGGVA